MPLGAGNVVKSITRKRKRVTFPPVLLTIVFRMSSVPKVELFTGLDVKSRTRFGGDAAPTQVSSTFASKDALLERLVETRLNEIIERHLARTRDPHETPAAEVRDTLHLVAQMWVEHGVVLAAAAELAGSVPSVFDLIETVIEAAVLSRAKLFVEAGNTPEVADLQTARETAAALLWMSERSFYVLSRRNPPAEEFHALADRLYAICARTAGLEDPQP